jgi:superfamily I DNA/RNA helicase
MKMNLVPHLPTRLTSAQRDAILHTGSSLLIIASPVSGKTMVITWRVVPLAQVG